MKINKYCTKEFDKEFSQIKGIKYLPWVGIDSQKKIEKILIVGESVYNWEKDVVARKNAQEKLEQNNFARIVVFEHGIENPSLKRKFARNIEKTLSNKFESETERIEFWKNICFHELVQRPLKNRKERPTEIDYLNGGKVLTSIIEILQPKKCIFLGTTWSKFINLKKSLKKFYSINVTHYAKINNGAPKTIFIKELNTMIYFIKHPSTAYSPEVWKNFIKNN